MNIKIKATGLDLTEPISIYLQEKIGSLSKFMKEWEQGGSVEARIEIARTTKHHQKGAVYKAEVNIRVPGNLFRAEDEDWDIRVAIDKVRERLQREIKRHKEHIRRLSRKK